MTFCYFIVLATLAMESLLRWGKGRISEVVPPELEQFGIHPGISSDMVFIDRNVLLVRFFEGVGRFG